MNKKTLFKKILSFLLVIMLILPSVSEVSMAVINAAENETSDETAYEHDGYMVVYKVASEWEGHKAIEVTLKNTGTKCITNWALSINNTGGIGGLWNAVLIKTDADKYTVKCMDYNNTIPAGQSVTFGYTLAGSDLSAPDDISMCALESVLSEGFDVEYKVTGDWGTGFQGEIKIVNESKQAIEGWKLNFKGNFDVLNYWNCELTENADGTYTISHTSWQNSIPAGGEYVIGFVGSKTDDEMVISDVKMIVTGRGAGFGETETDPTSPSEPETSPVVPTEPVTEPTTETPTEPTTPSETKPAETEPTTSAPEINWEDETDTDDDGLPDVYEIHTFGTNPKNADTDGDSLPDAYEIINLGTDPTKADSDNNGITDDKEDADNDGLDNLTEYQLGTNPTSADGDYDGLSDKEEIENYGTDPSDFDTDDDGIGDGDELKLGLDPLNSSTNGVPDGQYTITQTIGADSEVLCDVNSSTENPFELSLEVKAAGLADKSLTVNGSTENAMFQNESYVGELITIDYKDTMGFESIQINFAMDEAVLENELDLFGDETTELKGIRRFNVFKFVEEMNMLLPIETFHDEETNTVYTVTDDDGMYYLVDMEKWLYGLQQLNAEEEAQVMSLSLDEGQYIETTADNVETDVTTVQNQTGEGITEELKEEMIALVQMIESGNVPMTMSYSEEWHSDAEMIQSNQPIDIVFVIQTDCIWSEPYREFASVCIFAWMSFLEKKYTNMRASVLCRTKTENYFIGDNYFTPQWYTDPDDVWENAPKYEDYIVEQNCLIREYFDIFLDQEVMEYREDAAKFVVDVQWGSNMMDYYYFSYCMEQMAEQGIVFCEIHEIQNAYSSYTNMVKRKIELTGGAIFSIEESDYAFCVPDLVHEIVSKRVEPQTKFKAIVATGYEEITLDEPLRDGSATDTDEDTLTDWDEVYTEMLNWDVYGNLVLPTLKFCIDNASEKSYVVNGLERFKSDNTPAGMPSNIYEEYIEEILEKTYVLPIHSNPVDKNSDSDGYDDEYDMKPLSQYNNGEWLDIFSDENWQLYELYCGGADSNFSEQQIECVTEMEHNITLIQQCLRYLGYIENEINSYGVFGGTTRSALQLYQINHGFSPLKYGEKGIDINTYSDLVNNAINRGFPYGVVCESEETYEKYALEYSLNEKYYDSRAVKEPLLNYDLTKAGVKLQRTNWTEQITVDLKQCKENRYYYDYTDVLNNVIELGSKEFHNHYYLCEQNVINGLGINQYYGHTVYVDSDLLCCRKTNDILWMISKVKNNTKYDIKVRNCWNALMEEIGVQVYFYGSHFDFCYNGSVINAEQFGNILFGAIGNAGGFYLSDLQVGGSVYSFLTTLQFDNYDDSQRILQGYNYCDTLIDSYYYLH